eukprot:313149-Pelagomonas_calceolata.AAC.1
MTGLVSVCGPLRASQRGARSPPWFDAACRGKRRVFMEALRTGQPLHAREFVRRQCKIQVQWSKRAYTWRQRDVFLGRLYSEDPDVHAMLRRSKCTQAIPVALSVWDKYLKAHFQPREAGIWLFLWVVVVMLRLERAQGTQNNWVPEPDAVAVPSEEEMQGLVAEQIGKMDGRASPGKRKEKSTQVKGRVH